VSFRIEVSRIAETQIEAAADWWLKNRLKAPAAFAEEIERAFTLVCSLPFVGEPISHSRRKGVRRLLLGRVHYHLYYQVSTEAETVEVLALWHTSRGSKPTL